MEWLVYALTAWFRRVFRGATATPPPKPWHPDHPDNINDSDGDDWMPMPGEVGKGSFAPQPDPLAWAENLFNNLPEPTPGQKAASNAKIQKLIADMIAKSEAHNAAQAAEEAAREAKMAELMEIARRTDASMARTASWEAALNYTVLYDEAAPERKKTMRRALKPLVRMFQAVGGFEEFGTAEGIGKTPAMQFIEWLKDVPADAGQDHMLARVAVSNMAYLADCYASHRAGNAEIDYDYDSIRQLWQQIAQMGESEA